MATSQSTIDKGRIAGAINEFQSETEEMRDTAVPSPPRVAVWVLAAMLGSCGLIMGFMSVDRVVTSVGGKVVPTQAVNVFQALDASIIKSLDVKEGQQVEPGQALASLDQTFATADVTQLKLQLASLDAQIARGEAELAGTPPVFPQLDDPDHARYAALQRVLHEQRQGQYKAQLASFDEKVRQIQATINKLSVDEGHYAEREKISKQIEEMRSVLLQKQAGSLLNLLAASDQRQEILRTMDYGHNSLIEARHQLAAINADRVAFQQQWIATASQDVVSARNTRDTAMSQLSKASKHEDLVKIVSPEKAVVLTVAKLSVGSILKAGDPLLTLMPLSVPMEAELRVLSRDVGFIRVNDPVTLKVDAFNFIEHGAAEGKVRWISEGAFTTDDDGKPVDAYYKVRASVDKLNFVNVPSTMRIIPGMTLSGDVFVGTRSLARYIFGGAIRATSEAMRER